MESVNQFNKGINKDSNPLFQPKNTAKELKHWVQISEDGDTYSLINENGVINQRVSFPSGFKLMGQTVLNNDIIVVLASDLGYSQVGIIDYNKTYTRIAPSDDLGSQLGFTTDHPVDCVAKKTYAGERVLYYTDDNVPFGSVNLDNPPEDDSLEENSKLIADLDEPFIVPSEIIQGGGELYCGTYQFSLRYVKEDLSNTIMLGTTQPVPIVDEAVGAKRKEKDGNTTTTVVSKSIKINLTNLDQDYKQYQLIAHRYTDDGNVLKSYALPPKELTATTSIYNFTGIGLEDEEIPLEEVREVLISYNKAKCIEQLDNRLILGNLSEATNQFDDELQNIANNINLRYKIEEVPYRYSNKNVGDFNLVGIWKAEETEYFPNTVGFTFTDNVELEPLLDSIKAYEVGGSSGSITILDIATLENDTITVDGEIFTFVTSVVNSNDVLIGVDINATTITLKTVMENSRLGTVFNFGGSSLGGLVTMVTIRPGDETFPITTTAGSLELTVTGIDGGTPLEDKEILPTNIVVEGNKAYAYFNYDTHTEYYFQIFDIKNWDGSKSYSTTQLEASVENEIDYEITGILADNESQAYKDEFFTTYRKGYKREEVYSYAIKTKFKDGSDSYTYHIPGNNKITGTTIEAIPDSPGTVVGNTEGELGTYVSDIEYPLDQGFVGTYVRHHKMPSLQQEPHFRKVTETVGDEEVTEIYIRILGLEAEFTIPFSQDLVDNIQNFSIVRESREKEGNKSILAQGIGLPMLDLFTNYEPGNGNTIAASRAYCPQPYLGSFEFKGDNYSNNKDFVLDIVGIKRDLLNFHSPDLTLGNSLDVDKFENNKIKAKLGVKGDINDFFRKTGNFQIDPKYLKSTTRVSRVREWWQAMLIGIPGNIDYFNHRLKKNPKLWQGCSFQESSVTLYDDEFDVYDDECLVEKTVTVNSGDFKGVGFDEDVYNLNGLKSYILKTGSIPGGTNNNVRNGSRVKTTLSASYSAKTDSIDANDYEDRRNDSDYYANEKRSNLGIYTGTSTATLNILEVSSDITGQYGELPNSEYIETYRSNNPPTVPTTINNIYGGDVFITPYSVENKNVLPMMASYYSDHPYEEGNEDYQFRGEANDDCEPDKLGINSKCLYEVFLESRINCDFRHEFFNDEDEQQTRYYPKSTAYETLKVATEKGRCISYNPQYSIENSIKTYFSKSLSGNIQGDFEDRIIYSDNSSLDSIVDNYKQFPVNNYQDIPKHTGEIWDLFVYNDTLYSHTPKSLWRMFSKNNSTMTSSDISEVILGTGDAYTIDAQRRTDFKGGYAGTISQFAGVHTPGGYIFPDALQGKVFIFTPGSKQGDLQELSRNGMLTVFNNGLKKGLVESGVYIDNPYTGYGILASYDFELKRYLITKKDSFGGLTYSFSFVGDCWLSEHDYRPDAYISIDNDLYMVSNTGTVSLYKTNDGLKGDFAELVNYTTRAESTIRFIVNDNIDVTKVFDNIVLNTNSYSNLGEYVPFDTFDTVQMSNDLQDTSEKEIVIDNGYPTLPSTQVQCKFKNNEYRVSVPRGASDDRIKSKYSIIDLKYNNTNDNKFVVNFIKTLFRVNRR